MDVRFAHARSALSRRCLAAAGLAGLLLAALPAQAAWQLAPDQSQVTATIVEITPSGPVPHTHRVRRLQGDLSGEGTLRLPLRLNQTDVMDKLGQLPTWLSGLADTPLATVVTQFPPSRLDALGVGESLTETLMLRVQSDKGNRQEPLEMRFTRESTDTIHVENAQRVVLDGQALMSDQNARSVLMLLGYEQIGDEVPIRLDATLIDR
ncbi:MULTISPECIES: hypothetical protein [unclassified Modicisalibacter]|uniref:hypothetical protein n=1 Tax=unclassified Modicisalibacter TaxID=2679913 RepID=UPI001CCB1681|nr:MULTISPECIES: hypothetical protein [unclassified Modicisalibacter]